MKAEKIIDKLKNNKELEESEINFIVKNFTNGKIDDKTMSDFLILVKEKGLNFTETFYLTKSMIETGDILDLSNINKVVVDKHSTGGVGDKVTLIVSPIVASLGLSIAKMSGRSLGFTGGTIDKLESIPGYNVNLTNEQFENIVNNVGMSIISSTTTLAPADKKIYALRDEIGAVDSIPLIASSIMSKKIASGAKNIVIDLKVGTGAFMKNLKDAQTLANYMIEIGKFFDRKVICVLTDMNAPLGFMVGNALEVQEAINFFNGKREKRLENLIIEIASNMISLGKNIDYDTAKEQVIETLNKGLAKNKFYEWIKAQGGNIEKLKLSEKVLTIKSPKSGYINEINPLKISELVFNLGAGRTKKEDKIDLSVGIELIHTLYEKVEKDSPLINIYYNNELNEEDIHIEEFIKIESILKKEKDIIISVIK